LNAALSHDTAILRLVWVQDIRLICPVLAAEKRGYTADMSAKPVRFGLRQLFAAITLTAIILGASVYVAKSYREEQIRVFQKAYAEGRVTESTARGYVGDIVDTWPSPKQPIQRTRHRNSLSKNNSPAR
jgi:hypothetical protein